MPARKMRGAVPTTIPALTTRITQERTSCAPGMSPAPDRRGTVINEVVGKRVSPTANGPLGLARIIALKKNGTKKRIVTTATTCWLCWYSGNALPMLTMMPVSYTHLRAHETDSYLVCRLLLEKKKKP